MHNEALQADHQVQVISQLSSIIAHLSTITATVTLAELLNYVLTNMPQLVDATTCSIYLRPELVPSYQGQLISVGRSAVAPETLAQGFIVLAATNCRDKARLIGRACYGAGEGLGGWVFSHGRPLRLNHDTNRAELHTVIPDLHWTNAGDDRSAAGGNSDQSAILIVPLIAHAGVFGIIEFSTPMNEQPFASTSEDIAVIAAQVIANTLEKTWALEQQDQHIQQLVSIGTKQNIRELLEAVTERVGSMLGTRTCQLYLRGKGGCSVQLAVENGRAVTGDVVAVIARGHDLIGWIFKTGKPLLLGDSREYVSGRSLNNKRLDLISNGAPIDDEDRSLKCAGAASNWPVPFLGVPVIGSDGSVLGVLCVNTPQSTNPRHQPFKRDDLKLAQAFARTIALAIDNARERQLSDLLIQLGDGWDPEEMFEAVVKQVPDLVSGTGCSIYLAENSHGLRLARTSREGLTHADSMAKMTYRLGEGKTGYCALAQATLIVNHYGPGEAAQQAIEAERDRIRAERRDDLTEPLWDDHHRRVGIIQLRRGVLQRGAQVLPQVQREFLNLARQLTVRPNAGLPSPKANSHAQLGSRPSWSFVAIPIKSEANDLYGVITIGRPVEQSPFSTSDVTLLESIAGRLASVLHNVKLREQQTRMLLTLAHEINTPLQGILADAENMITEAPPESEIKGLASHTLNQVQQLHLLTETIMAVLTEQTPARSFSIHNLYRPLKEACEMFSSEAALKGCDILEPKPIGSRFPEIEMSLFDLTLAFKNLIHNAIKYSFNPPRAYEGHRYIRILGHWVEEQQAYSISIENYGVGIPQAEIDGRAIFAPYYRGVKASDRCRTGAGLGLAHVRQVIEELHHGTITVTSKPLFGEAYLTTFVVTLPVRQSVTLQSSPAQVTERLS